jgi:hypothetical protein
MGRQKETGAGRPRQKGDKGVAKETRIKETARLLVWGWSVQQLAYRFGVTQATATNYVKEAKKLGYVDKFTEVRDSQVGVIVAANFDILTGTTELIKTEVDAWGKLDRNNPEDKKKMPSMSTLLAVSAHAAKITGAIQETGPADINIQQVQQNIIMLQKAEDDLMEQLGFGKGKVTDVKVKVVH